MKSSTNIGSRWGGDSMYRLRDLKNGKFQIHVKDGEAYEGTLNMILRQCLKIGLDLNEVETAILELEFMGHDYAEFGVFGTFMYSMMDEEKAA